MCVYIYIYRERERERDRKIERERQTKRDTATTAGCTRNKRGGVARELSVWGVDQRVEE